MLIKTISIEGSDGAGKATTTKLLKSYFFGLGKKWLLSLFLDTMIL